MANLKDNSVNVIVTGHFNGELWALDTDPNQNNIFVTAGEDNSINLWDASSHKLLTSGIISNKKGKRSKSDTLASTTSTLPAWKCARACAFSPNSKHLAIGTNYGHLIIIDLKTMSTIIEHDLNSYSKRKVTNQKGNWIQSIKYSPNGQTLAVGTHGSVIILCNVKKDYKPSRKALTAHNAAIIHLDWSNDSQILRSNCLAYELLFHTIDHHKLSNSKHDSHSSKYKDIEWYSNDCVFSWGSQAVCDEDAGLNHILIHYMIQLIVLIMMLCYYNQILKLVLKY